MNYGWVITRDRFAERFKKTSNSVGVMGPRDVQFTKEEITKNGKRFSMYCDDRECWLEGYLLNGEGFEPLDDFGTASHGCVHIKINGEWI
jgi:hypothetical protein